MPLEVAAFSGCGVRLTAYAGAIKILAEQDQLRSIKTLLGTSGGAITALLLAVGYDAAQLETLIFNIDYYKEISDNVTLLSELYELCAKGGFYKAEHLQKTLSELIKKQTGSSDTTFAELKDLGLKQPLIYRNLVVLAANLNAEHNPLTVFSHKTTPNVRLVDAAFASACAPLYFIPHAFKFPMAEGEKLCYFADGGMLCNDPFDYYVNQHVKDSSLYHRSINFIIGTQATLLDSKTYRPFKPSIFHNAKAELIALIDANEELPLSNPKVVERTVFIDPKDISPMKLKLSKAQKSQLIQSGIEATQCFFDHHPELESRSKLTWFGDIDPLLQPVPPLLHRDKQGTSINDAGDRTYTSYFSFRCNIL